MSLDRQGIEPFGGSSMKIQWHPWGSSWRRSPCGTNEAQATLCLIDLHTEPSERWTTKDRSKGERKRSRKGIVKCFNMYLGFGGEEGGGHELVRKMCDHCTWSGQLIHNECQSFLLQPGDPVPVGNGVERCDVPSIQNQRQDLLHPDCTCKKAKLASKRLMSFFFSFFF